MRITFPLLHKPFSGDLFHRYGAAKGSEKKLKVANGNNKN
jgi:hypothetical protein